MHYFCSVVFLTFTSVISIIFGQENEQNLIDQVFVVSNNTFGNLYEEVTSDSLESLGALTRCGEGDDEGIHRCVHYTRCHPQTKQILTDNDAREVDGFGVIDIR